MDNLCHIQRHSPRPRWCQASRQSTEQRVQMAWRTWRSSVRGTAVICRDCICQHADVMRLSTGLTIPNAEMFATTLAMQKSCRQLWPMTASGASTNHRCKDKSQESNEDREEVDNGKLQVLLPVRDSPALAFKAMQLHNPLPVIAPLGFPFQFAACRDESLQEQEKHKQ